MSRNKNFRRTGFVLGLVVTGSLIGCAKAPVASFQNDVKPILDANCAACHQPGAEAADATGLLLDSYEGVMRGTRFGRVVIPGDNLTSALVMLIEGRADPSISMPHNGENLTPEEIDKIRAWVEQGAENN